MVTGFLMHHFYLVPLGSHVYIFHDVVSFVSFIIHDVLVRDSKRMTHRGEVFAERMELKRRNPELALYQMESLV